MKDYRVLISIVCVIVFVFLAVGSTGNNDEPAAEVEEEETETEPVQEEDMIEITFKESIDFYDDRIIISGTTNLMDGVSLSFEVDNLSRMDLDDYIEGEIIVQDGSFNQEVDISGFSDGEILVWLAFLPYMQTDEIMEVYGGMGDYIFGGNVEYSQAIGANQITIEVINQIGDIKDNEQIVLEILEENFEGLAVIELDSEEKTFFITPGEEVIPDLLAIQTGDPQAVQAWNEAVEAFMFASNSIKGMLPGYALALRNPANPELILLAVLDGSVIYNFLND